METIYTTPFFAEIIESSLQKWKAQSWKWDIIPHFSSIMVIENENYSVFGIVYHIETGSGRADRIAFPYQKTEKELLQEQPHIFEFLQTHFTCLTLGYKEPGKPLVNQYAPQPPKIHAFVRQATREELQLFFSDDRYITMLFAHENDSFNLDELLLGLIRLRIQNSLLTQKQLKGFFETFSLLTGNDYRRLKLFLYRVQPLIEDSSCLIS